MRKPASTEVNKVQAVWFFLTNKRITQTLAEFQLIVGYRHCGAASLSILQTIKVNK